MINNTLFHEEIVKYTHTVQLQQCTKFISDWMFVTDAFEFMQCHNYVEFFTTFSFGQSSSNYKGTNLITCIPFLCQTCLM